MSIVADLWVRNLIKRKKDDKDWTLEGANLPFSLIWPLEWDDEELLKNSEVDDLNPYSG